MIIKKKRINSTDKYLKAFKESEYIYVAVQCNDEIKGILKRKSGIEVYEKGLKIIPKPCGKVTERNMYGEFVVCKDKAKEFRTYEREYHVIDWHKKDHYGTCYVTILCYPKIFVEPQLEEIILDANVIKSEKIEISDKKRISHIVNMFLEIFGYCEIFDEGEKVLSSDIQIKSISWEILPPGEYPWDRILSNSWKKAKGSKKNNLVVEKRHKVISSFRPDFMAYGANGFNGYVVYGFKSKSLFIFESNQLDQATYVFKGDWEEFSKLTKRDVIKGRLCYARIIHCSTWEKEISNLFGKS